MTLTGIELLQKIKDDEIKENSEFKIRISEENTWSEKIRYEENDLVFRENIITNEEGNMYGRTIFNLWNLKSILEMKFELIEENKEIEELKKALNKLNETFDKAYNKLIKESEEK